MRLVTYFYQDGKFVNTFSIQGILKTILKGFLIFRIKKQTVDIAPIPAVIRISSVTPKLLFRVRIPAVVMIPSWLTVWMWPLITPFLTSITTYCCRFSSMIIPSGIVQGYILTSIATWINLWAILPRYMRMLKINVFCFNQILFLS